MSYACPKPAFLLFFAFVIMQKTTATVVMHSIDNSGNETDRVALLSIKSQLIDHPSGVLSSWNDSIHHCAWDGVICGRKHNRVTVLDLSSRGLAGTISPFIGNLSFLEIIRLYNNSLSGEIPTQIGRILRLQHFWLYNNTLGGEIPGNISRCINLRYLSVSQNQLEGKLPAGLRALSRLIDFSVHRNNLTGPLFDVIQNLTSLERISVGFNSFTGTIPNSICRMQNLTALAIAENKLSGTVPMSLFNISSLQSLDLIGNQLHGELPTHIGFTIPNLSWLNLAKNYFSGSIPITILNLTTLGYIALDDNYFTGTVPRDFGYFPSLRTLNLQGNYLAGDIGFISSLVNCSHLRVLDLGPNNFYGKVPESVANLSTSLEWFVIEYTSISGTIPAGITNLVNLNVLIIDNCKLTGALPHDLGKLNFLESIFFNGNRLSGRIPNSLGNLSYLIEVHLQDNLFEGILPLSLGNCKSLRHLNLSSNELSGSLGAALISGFAAFIELDLSQNHLEGPLPLEIRKQTSLENFKLSKNKFSGMIPNGLGDCLNLQYLYIDGNSFHGEIPSSFASLANLREIDFSRNNLSGPIPVFFSNFQALSYLDLSYNNFEGRVPTNSVFANVSAVFVAGNGRLCGGIRQMHLPKCIGNKTTMSRPIKLIILVSTLIGMLAMAAGLYLTCIKKKKTSLSTGSMMGSVTEKVSYNMLLKATAGFSTENLLGTGSFGYVFKGILEGEMVAVKVLNMEHRGALKSFMAECNTLRNARHRNLVGIITVCASLDFQRNDFRALVYEFMTNRSLDRWLNGVEGKLSVTQRVDIAIDVAHALNYLHHDCETPIVHCDLKPSNILLDDDMVAHVGDFGIASFLTQPLDTDQCSTTGIRGTIGYTAPEYGLGSEASTDGDVYSYGILLLELMTGKSPTDSLFKGNYNLHKYAQEALPDQVLQILDPSLEEDNQTKEAALQQIKKVDCIITVIGVGVSCSNHLPNNRMKITDAISRLQSARESLLNARKGRNRPYSNSISFNNSEGQLPEGSGALSEKFRRLQKIEVLQFSENKLSGALPTSLFNLSFLKYLEFSYNNLEGEVPTITGLTLPRLTRLNISNFHNKSYEPRVYSTAT